MTMMLSVGDRAFIPVTYREFVELFSKTNTESLPQYQLIDHAKNSGPRQNLHLIGVEQGTLHFL